MERSAMVLLVSDHGIACFEVHAALIFEIEVQTEVELGRWRTNLK